MVRDVDLRLLRYFRTVVEQRHVGRAAVRLHMTQPPLSRAMRQLEADLGTVLLHRTAHGVIPTAAGEALYQEAGAVLERIDQLRDRVRAVAGTPTLRIGTLADTAELVSSRLVDAFRRDHPHVVVTVHEADLSDPTAGLRAGQVDVAFTRTPFEDTGVRAHVLSSEPVGMLVRADDPLAALPSVSVAALSDRAWIRLPDDTDPVWAGYWTGPARPDAPVLRTIQECVQSVLWNGASALAPLDQPLPPGLVTVPVDDREPNRLLLIWSDRNPDPLVRSLLRIAVAGPFAARR